MRASGDWLAVLCRNGQAAEQALRVIRLHLPIPAAPQHGKTVTHEEAIARMHGRLWIIRALAVVEGPKREHVAAVVDVIEQLAAALGGIHGFEQKEIRPALDLATRVARCPFQIAHARIRFKQRIGFEIHPPFDPLIRSRRAKALAVRKSRALRDLHAHDFSVNEGAREQKQAKAVRERHGEW